MGYKLLTGSLISEPGKGGFTKRRICAAMMTSMDEGLFVKFS